MNVDEKGWIHLNMDDVVVIHHDDGKISYMAVVDSMLEDIMDTSKDEKIAELRELLRDHEPSELCIHCNPEKDKEPLNIPDGRKQAKLPVEMES
jgi:hypothetical protein